MEIIQEAMEFVRGIFAGDAGGHDFDHTMRVYRMAVRIAEEEGADLELVGLAALLHDVDDHKLSPQTCDGKDRVAAFLHSHGVSENRTEQILRIISQISYSANRTPPESLEGKCVQDADRLDAMGAIGIARTFAYGGSKGRRIHDPEGLDDATSVRHFYDKLLRLESLMNTETGRSLARQRHEFMQTFLDRFFGEWEGKI